MPPFSASRLEFCSFLFGELISIHRSLHSLPSLAIPITSLSLSCFQSNYFSGWNSSDNLNSCFIFFTDKILKARTYSPYLKLNQGYQNNCKMSTWTKQFALAFRLVLQSFSFLRHSLHFYECICLLIYHWIPNFLSNLCISSNLSFSLRLLIFSNYLNNTHTHTHSLSLSLSLRLYSYVLMKSSELVRPRVFARRWTKSSFVTLRFRFLRWYTTFVLESFYLIRLLIFIAVALL